MIADSSPAKVKAERRTAKKGSVLVVDDEESCATCLRRCCPREGYRVDLAKTGEEGLDAYGRRAYDVVLLDVSMPGIGGLRALEGFLKLDADAVVVMITAYATFDTAIAAWERGALVVFASLFRTNKSAPPSPPVSSGGARKKSDAHCAGP